MKQKRKRRASNSYAFRVGMSPGEHPPCIKLANFTEILRNYYEDVFVHTLGLPVPVLNDMSYVCHNSCPHYDNVHSYDILFLLSALIYSRVRRGVWGQQPDLVRLRENSGGRLRVKGLSALGLRSSVRLRQHMAWWSWCGWGLSQWSWCAKARRGGGYSAALDLRSHN